MNFFGTNRTIKTISIIYFAVAFVLLIGEVAKLNPLIYLLKPSMIPVLLLLYIYTSKKRSYGYICTLLFSFSSNVFFLESTSERLLGGILTYMVYRFLTIVIVYKAIKIKKLLPLTIATVPFLFIFLSLLNLIKEVLHESFYPALINGLLMSFLGGLSLSNYVLDDNKKNSWLLISSLLFGTQVFIFTIQRYYLENAIFQPIAVIIYAISHYAFYKFVVLDEESNESEL